MKFLRGTAVSKLLSKFGIDPPKFWILVDLFGELAYRREVLNNLGRDGVTLRKLAIIYGIMMGIGSVVAVVAGASVARYLGGFIFTGTFMLFMILFSETNNSLVNAAEGLVLAHQPVNGATYSAAKLTHLLRILAQLVPAFHGVPAFVGLFLTDAGWLYPLWHLAAAFGAALVAALFCCAIFGWLILLAPPSRIKSVSQWMDMGPMLVLLLAGRVGTVTSRWRTPAWLQPAVDVASKIPAWWLWTAGGAAAVAIVIYGLRALSGDFLVRVATVMHAGSGSRSKIRRRWTGGLAAKIFGGPAVRAGFEYLACMIWRDWNFKRQMLLFVVMLIPLFGGLGRNMGVSPFSRQFSPAHVIPHAVGFLLLMFTTSVPYGAQYKGAWILLLAPSGAMDGFARGVYAWLWMRVVITLHLILLPVGIWFWGVRDAVLLLSFSAAMASLYLALELPLIEGAPFTRQPKTADNSFILPLMIGGGMVVAALVGIQHFLLFRSPLAVGLVTVALGVAAWLVTRHTLGTLAGAIRYHLGLINQESAAIYHEIET